MAVINWENRRSGCYLGQSRSLNEINEEIIIASGAGVLYPGTVLGKITVGGASSAAKSGGNTGNGTFVLDATTPVLANAEPGVYALRFTSTTNVRLEDWRGRILGDFTIGTANGNNVTIAEQIKGVVTQGSVGFAAGDGFDVTVAAGSGKRVLHDAALTNGAQNAESILFHKVDATSADVKTVATVRGPATINGNDLIFKSGISNANQLAAKQALRAKGLAVLPQHADDVN